MRIQNRSHVGEEKSKQSDRKSWIIYTFICCCCLVTSVMPDSVRPYGLQPARILYPWDSPSKNTGVGCHALLQGNLLNQWIKPRSPALQADSLLLSHQGIHIRLYMQCLLYIRNYAKPWIWIISKADRVLQHRVASAMAEVSVGVMESQPGEWQGQSYKNSWRSWSFWQFLTLRYLKEISLVSSYPTEQPSPPLSICLSPECSQLTFFFRVHQVWGDF